MLQLLISNLINLPHLRYKNELTRSPCLMIAINIFKMKIDFINAVLLFIVAMSFTFEQHQLGKKLLFNVSSRKRKYIIRKYHLLLHGIQVRTVSLMLHTLRNQKSTLKLVAYPDVCEAWHYHTLKNKISWRS